MSNHSIHSHNLTVERNQPPETIRPIESSQDLPISITKTASKQTYYTIRFLVDPDRTLNAYRAYAYFRWVDNWVDERAATKSERIAFVERQQRLVNGCYQDAWIGSLCAEESILVDLIKSDHEQQSGLQSYIRNMMAVMAFDTQRRDRLISQQELVEYSRYLSIAVTDALHYFIGHDDPASDSEARYFAVMGAHITHLLRDTFEDVEAGYYNVPCEFLEQHKITARDVHTDAYREWVKIRVQLAHEYFDCGRSYIQQVKNCRCRIAGYAYIARFETVLDLIEKDNFWLRPEYKERKSLRGGLFMFGSLVSMLLKDLMRG